METVTEKMATEQEEKAIQEKKQQISKVIASRMSELELSNTDMIRMGWAVNAMARLTAGQTSYGVDLLIKACLDLDLELTIKPKRKKAM